MSEPTAAQIAVAKKVLAAIRASNHATASIPVMHPVTGKPRCFEEYRSEYLCGDYDPIENPDEVCIFLECDECLRVEELFDATILEENSFKVGLRTFCLFVEMVSLSKVLIENPVNFAP